VNRVVWAIVLIMTLAGCVTSAVYFINRVFVDKHLGFKALCNNVDDMRSHVSPTRMRKKKAKKEEKRKKKKEKGKRRKKKAKGEKIQEGRGSKAVLIKCCPRFGQESCA
jgi:hypothetical protein